MVTLRRLLMMGGRRLTLTRLLVLGVVVAVCIIVYFSRDWTPQAKARIGSDGNPPVEKGSRRPGSKASERSRPLDVARVEEYCNIPTQVVEGDEGDAPEDYTLLSAYILIRHGDRTPLASSLLNVPPPSPHNGCNMKAAATVDVLRKVPELRNFVRDMEAQEERQPTRGDFAHWALYPQHSTCGSSQLTGQGVAQHLLNGLSLRRKYQHRWGLLSPTTFSPSAHLAVHSTVISRTYQSALALVYGLLQPQPPTPANFDLSELHVQPASNVMFCRPSLVPTVCCVSLSKLRQEADMAVRILRAQDRDWQAAMPPLAEVFGVKAGKLPGATRLLDFLQGHACHGIPLPCGEQDEERCVTPAMMERLWALVDGAGNRSSREPAFDRYARTVMHSLLLELGKSMVDVALNRSEVKITLYSGHDLTLTPMLQTLGLYDGRWPGYATRLVWELYRRHSVPRKHYVRLVLNGGDVTSRVRFCKGQTQDGGMCPLKHFEHFVMFDNLEAIGVSDMKGLEDFCKSKVL